MNLSRRSLVKAMLGGAAAVPLAAALGRRAHAGPALGAAKRLIILYFPDGIPQPDGQPSRWHMPGGNGAPTLVDTLSPLAPFEDACVFLNNLSMGATDSGSHPGGAKKLLTATDGGNGLSIDRALAKTVGSSAPFSHVYLGAAATYANASGDKYISYPSPGTTVAPQDDPLKAFQELFGQKAGSGGMMTGAGGMAASAGDAATKSVVDANLAELNDLRAKLGDVEKSKLDLHVEALNELEKQLSPMAGTPPVTCDKPAVDTSGFDASSLFDPAKFPAVLKAQMDVMVQAMACGLTRIGVIQASQHTSELIMSRFPGTELYTPNYDMRSHQASHYGQTSDAKYDSYVKQRRWFVSQYAYLLDQLKQRPEGNGTMLDNSLVLLCSEVADGNTHKHDDMPFILAGKGGGAIKTGQVLDDGVRRHADLLIAIANAMGDPMTSFGDTSSGPLPGLLA